MDQRKRHGCGMTGSDTHDESTVSQRGVPLTMLRRREEGGCEEYTLMRRVVTT